MSLFLHRGHLSWLGILWVTLFSFNLEAQNTLRWATNYYLITGNDTDELRAAMHQSKPWKNESGMETIVGLTSWHIGWQFRVTPTPHGCRCTSFTTTTSITNTLPRWLPPTNAPIELKTAWARFATALARHEDGHSRIALAAVADLHKQIAALSEDLDCDTLKKSINDLTKRTLDDYRKRDVDYDRATNHGVTQGASLGNFRRRDPN